MEYTEFMDYDYFFGKLQFLKYLKESVFRKSYQIKFDPDAGKKRKFSYWDIPAAFDIETTSFRDAEGNKKACMYLWGFNLNGRSTYGRTWEEFLALLEILRDVLNTAEQTLIIYVHNLAYEFQFMRKRLQWLDVFSLRDHQPIRARTKDGLEFRCSLIESGKKLALLAEGIREHPIKKLDTLEYTGLRHPKTPVTDLELMYQLNDVRIVANYIYEKGKSRTGGICALPMTKTGYVRDRFRRGTIYNPDRNISQHYRKLMKELTLKPAEYLQLEATFQGGFVHGNALYIGDMLLNVASFDEISAYPAAMVGNMFPMSKGRYFANPDAEQLYKSLKYYCCIFKWEVFDLQQKPGIYDNPISQEHCFEKLGTVENNGRIVSADHLYMYITNVDLEIYREFYTWDEQRTNISMLWRYHAGYLPRPFLDVLLELYENKTKLKGLTSEDGHIEELYLLSKEDLNSSYGMIVQRVIRSLVVYENDKYKEERPDIPAMIAKENRSRKRFTFYPWGVFVTAYARRAVLLGAVKPCGSDYVYSDTDSAKILNAEKYIDHFKEYNDRIREKMYKTCDFYRFDRSRVEPETVKGEKKLLGAFEYEHDGKPYERFKTLGAKRYMTYSEGKFEITVAGLGKAAGCKYLQFCDDRPYVPSLDEIFDEFNNDLTVPAKYTGKLTHTYLDDEYQCTLIDMFGRPEVVHEYSGINLEPCEFTMNLSKQFIKFLSGYKEVFGLYGND